MRNALKVTTVGGLVTGLRGAKIAASAILGRTNYFQQAVALRQELSVHLFIRKLLNRFGGADYDRLLDLFNPATIRLLGRHNRDHAAGVICRLMFAQPRFFKFAPFVARAVWKNLTGSVDNIHARRTNRSARA